MEDEQFKQSMKRLKAIYNEIEQWHFAQVGLVGKMKNEQDIQNYLDLKVNLESFIGDYRKNPLTKDTL